MHDAIIAERLNLPAVGIMTEQFVSAAALMARVLGAANFAFVRTAHPISSASDAELAKRARQAVRESAAILLGTPGESEQPE